jgi:ferredoxin-NADP reductase
MCDTPQTATSRLYGSGYCASCSPISRARRWPVSCPDIPHYKAGQYVQVLVNEHMVRSYSLASAPGIDNELHLHIRRGAAGSASRWFHDELKTGDAIHIGPPHGYCCYQPENLDQPVLMIGTGTGLAPLYGMARAALQQGHRGGIFTMARGTVRNCIWSSSCRHCPIFIGISTVCHASQAKQ